MGSPAGIKPQPLKYHSITITINLRWVTTKYTRLQEIKHFFRFIQNPAGSNYYYRDANPGTRLILVGANFTTLRVQGKEFPRQKRPPSRLRALDTLSL